MSVLIGIARGIAAHLHRMERDPALNPRSPEGWGPFRFHNPRAEQSGYGVRVTYRQNDKPLFLRRDLALEYLRWLDSGHNGTFFDMAGAPAATRTDP